MEKLVEVFESDPVLREGRYGIIFGHDASARVAKVLARKLGLPHESYFPTHAQYGNTVSATVPLGMSLAIKECKLQRGQRVLVIIGSSGITIGFASFTF